jgi:hypothetical protein
MFALPRQRLSVSGREDPAVVIFDQDHANSKVQNQMKARQYRRNEKTSWRILDQGMPHQKRLTTAITRLVALFPDFQLT